MRLARVATRCNSRLYVPSGACDCVFSGTSPDTHNRSVATLDQASIVRGGPLSPTEKQFAGTFFFHYEYGTNRGRLADDAGREGIPGALKVLARFFSARQITQPGQMGNFSAAIGVRVRSSACEYSERLDERGNLV